MAIVENGIYKWGVIDEQVLKNLIAKKPAIHYNVQNAFLNPNVWVNDINKAPAKSPFDIVTERLNNIPLELYKAKSLTGSYYITEAKEYEDIDYVMYTTDPVELDNWLHKKGYKTDGKDGYPVGVWRSYRNGYLNLIVTDNYKYYMRFLAATQLARYMKLMKKQDRIDLFDLILQNENEIPF